MVMTVFDRCLTHKEVIILDFKVNFNESIKVKLTPCGNRILQKQYDNLNKIIKNNGGEGLDEW